MAELAIGSGSLLLRNGAAGSPRRGLAQILLPSWVWAGMVLAPKGLGITCYYSTPCGEVTSIVGTPHELNPRAPVDFALLFQRADVLLNRKAGTTTMAKSFQVNDIYSGFVRVNGNRYLITTGTGEVGICPGVAAFAYDARHVSRKDTYDSYQDFCDDVWGVDRRCADWTELAQECAREGYRLIEPGTCAEALTDEEYLRARGEDE